MAEPIDWNQMSPMAMFRDWVAKSEAQWSESISTMLKDERAGGVLNKQIEEARQMQRMFAEMAQASLATVNLPSRSDIEALDERLGRLEDSMAAISAALVQLRMAVVNRGAARAAEAGGNPKPPRNRKPPARSSAKSAAKA